MPYDMRKHYGEELLDAVNKHEPNPLIKRGIPLEEQTINSVKFTKGNYLPKPTVGRIVHYYPCEDIPPQAAIITYVYANEEDIRYDACDLYQFGVDDPNQVCIYFSDTPKPGCWSWPPRD